jgi:hypothetical protein
VAILITQALLMVVPAIVVWVLEPFQPKGAQRTPSAALSYRPGRRHARWVPQLAMGDRPRPVGHRLARRGGRRRDVCRWPRWPPAVFGRPVDDVPGQPISAALVALAAATALLLGVMIVMGLGHRTVVPAAVHHAATADRRARDGCGTGSRRCCTRCTRCTRAPAGRPRVRRITRLPPRPSARRARRHRCPTLTVPAVGYPGSWPLAAGLGVAIVAA